MQTVGPIDFYYSGPGHSPDNIVANIKSVGILFGGCLVRPPNSRSLGNTEDANIAHWAKAVEAEALAIPMFEVIVPTHGPPGDRDLLELTTNLVRSSNEK